MLQMGIECIRIRYQPLKLDDSYMYMYMYLHTEGMQYVITVH